MMKDDFFISDKLKKQLLEEKDNIIFFIGAGLSIGSGLPSWQKLIEILCQTSGKTESLTLIKDCLNLNDKGSILQKIAEEIEIKMGPSKLLLNVRQIIKSINDVDMTIQNQLIIQEVLSAQCIFTTNYDTLIEKAIVLAGEQVEVYSYPTLLEKVGQKFGEILGGKTKDKRHVFKIHGSIHEDNGKIVLSKKSYDDAYNTQTQSIIAELKDRNVLFIGCSFADKYFSTEIQEKTGTGHWYALRAASKGKLTEIDNNPIIKSQRIESIYYLINDDNSNNEHKILITDFFPIWNLN